MISHGLGIRCIYHTVFRSFLAFLWLQQIIIATEATDAAHATRSCDPSKETCTAREEVTTESSSECGLWLAPSSLEGAGLGMYAGSDFKQGDLIGSGDIVIPNVDNENHQFALGDNYFLLWNEYYWSGSLLHMQHEGYVDVKAASPGFGSAANCFLDLLNVDEGVPTNSIPHGLHRFRDPGAGAFSTYHNRTSSARIDIKQGQELFVDYGEQWFVDRPALGPIPLFGHLNTATKLFHHFKNIGDRNPHLSHLLLDELWETFVENSEFNDSRVFGSFHKTDSEWEKLHANMNMTAIRVEESTRSIEWLQEHGVCADNLVADVSTIEQAGHGAFAKRRLAKGSLIAQVPLIHVADKQIFEMYEFSDILTHKTEHVLLGYQLQLNYCFGHAESTLLLCPYGPMTSLINHNQTLANVKLQWADPKRGNHEPSLLGRPIEHFAKDGSAKLAMELVATRDIQPNEEVFLDYGHLWEQAWWEHVRNWEPSEADKFYIAASQLNEDERLLTIFEQFHFPYPVNVELKCDVNFFNRIDWSAFQNEGVVIFIDKDHNNYYLSCDVLRHREVDGALRYTAVASRPATDTEQERYEKLVDAPREAFRFVDRPYTSDMFLRNAFRHPIMIPDEMFPEMWMNL